jgi:predicted transcriptional regulator
MDRHSRLGDLQHAILRVLWDQGEATVADVHRALRRKRARALTTIATMLTKMERRGIVEHRVDGRQFVYRARVSAEEIRRSMIADLTARLFEGDVTALVSHLLTEQEIDPEELVRLRRMIVEKEREARHDDR